MSGNTDSTTAISSYMSGQADKKLAATTAAAVAPTGCDWNPFSGNSCESQGLGGIGNKASDLAGGVGNIARATAGQLDKEGPGGVWGFAVVSCAFLWETVAGCLPLAGVVGYTAANAINNVQGGRNWSAGWNYKDAGTAGTTALVGALAPETLLASGTAGFVLGTGSDIATQEMHHPWTMPNIGHAVCSGLGGAEGGMAFWTGNPAMKAVKSVMWNIATTAEAATICGGP
jgi:hypothetical protein